MPPDRDDTMSTGAEYPDHEAPDEQTDWLTIKTAAARLGVSERTVRRWIREDRLYAEKRPGPYGEQYFIPPGEITTAQAVTDVVRVDRAVDVATLAGALERHLAERDQRILDTLDTLRAEVGQAGQQTTDTLREELRRRDEALGEQLRAISQQLEALQEQEEQAGDDPAPRWWRFWQR